MKESDNLHVTEKAAKDLRITIIGMGRLMELIRPCYASLLETKERLASQVIATTMDERGLAEKAERLGFPVVLGNNDQVLKNHRPDIILFAPPPHIALSLTETVLAPYGEYCLEMGLEPPLVLAFPPSPGPEEYALRLPEEMKAAVTVPCLGADGGFVLSALPCFREGSKEAGCKKERIRSLTEKFFKPMAPVIFLESSGIPAYLGSACMYPVSGNICSDISLVSGQNEKLISAAMEGWMEGIADFRTDAGIDPCLEEIRQQTFNYSTNAKEGGPAAVRKLNMEECTPGGIGERVLMSYNGEVREKITALAGNCPKDRETASSALRELLRQEAKRLSALAAERAAGLHLSLEGSPELSEEQKSFYIRELINNGDKSGAKFSEALIKQLSAIDEKEPAAFCRTCSDLVFASFSAEAAELILWQTRMAYGARFGQGAAFKLIH